jgi:hypothetical protein
MVVEAFPPKLVTVAGEKLHDDPVGNPEHANETVELNPFSGVTVITAVPFCPAVTLTDDVDAETEKSGGTWLIVYAALAIALSA